MRIRPRVGSRRPLLATVTVGFALAAVSLALVGTRTAGTSPAVSDVPPHSHSGAGAMFAGVGDFAALSDSQRRVDDAAPRDPRGRAGSGGAAVVHRAGGRRGGPSPARSLLHRTGELGYEPSLGLLRDGSVLVTAAKVTNTGARVIWGPMVLRSRDRGASFQEVSPVVGGQRAHVISNDPYLYAEPRTGRVFSTNLVGAFCPQIARSDDGGATWANNPLTCTHVADHQSLFGGPPVSSKPTGYPHVLYYCAASLGAQDRAAASACQKSTDGGSTFVSTRGLPFRPTLMDGPGGNAIYCDGLLGQGAVGPDGAVYLPKNCRDPLLLVSRDEGDSWETIKIPTSLGVNTDTYGKPDHESSVAVDAKGVVHLSWVGRDRLPYLVSSRDGGRTWTRPLMVAPPGVVETNLPALAVTPGGRVAVAYLGSTTSPGRPFPNDSNCAAPTSTGPCGGGKAYADVTWNGYVTVTDTPLSADPIFTSASVNAPSDPLIVGECGPFRCQQQYDFIDVQLDAVGTPWAAFMDGCNSDRKCTLVGETVVGRLSGLRRHS